MLNANVNRKPLTRWSRVFTVIALLSLTLPIAGLGAQSTFVTVSGSVLDGTNRVLPNVIVVLTNASNQAKHKVRSDSTGRFEIVGVPAAEYVLEAKEPGSIINISSQMGHVGAARRTGQSGPKAGCCRC